MDYFHVNYYFRFDKIHDTEHLNLFHFLSLFDNELIFVDRLIAADLRNNSAWNQRYFVLNHTGFTPEVIQYELNYVMNRIRLVKNNESTWNFLRGLLQHGTAKLDQYSEVSRNCVAIRWNNRNIDISKRKWNQFIEWMKNVNTSLTWFQQERGRPFILYRHISDK